MTPVSHVSFCSSLSAYTHTLSPLLVVDASPGPLCMHACCCCCGPCGVLLENHPPPPPFSVTSPAVALPLCADPVDLSLIRARLATKSYYASLEMFVADVRRMCDNCRYYNAATTPYYSCAVKMQAAMEAALDATVLDAPAQA